MAFNSPVSVNLYQYGYRWFNNDGTTVANQTAFAITNQAISLPANTVKILRIGVYQTGADAVTTWRYVLQYRKNGGPWITCDGGTPTDAVISTAVWNDHDATAASLDAYNFVAGEATEATRNTVAIAVTAGNHTELVFSVRTITGQVAVGDIIQFRLLTMTAVWSGGTTVDGNELSQYYQYPTMYVAASGSGGGGVNVAERAEVLEVAQIGMETTPGTAVAATRRLLCVEIEPDIVTNIRHHRVAGNKFNTNSSKAKESATFKLDGYAAFDDMLYICSNIMQLVIPTTPSNNGIWTLNAGSGTFTLTYGGQTTTSLAISAAAAVVQTALEALTSIGAGNVLVTGTYPNFIVTFIGAQSTGTALTGAGTGFSVASTAAVNARRWTMIINPNSYDTIQAWTLEKGQLNQAGIGQQFAYALLQALSGRINKDEYSISGSGIARPPNDTFTMTTGGISDVSPLQIDPANISVFAGSAIAGVGAVSRLTRLTELEWGISGRYSGFMTIDDSQPSWVGHVESVPQLTIGMTIEHDASGQTFYARTRANTRQFVVVEAKGNNIEGTGNTAYPYRMKMTFPVKLDQPDRVVVDDVVCMKYSGEMEYDTSFGGAIKVEIDTARTAL